jgi:hypothetical protein
MSSTTFVDLSWVQFATTAPFHMTFPPLSVGLAIFRGRRSPRTLFRYFDTKADLAWPIKGGQTRAWSNASLADRTTRHPSTPYTMQSSICCAR